MRRQRALALDANTHRRETRERFLRVKPLHSLVLDLKRRLL